ncbi:Rv1733c family protein [Streptomyces manipurensis]|uniref:Rv1733c family protein n=1 Tax=Streptomyces manipurensis TaxID=1077945 RepID=UPI003C6F774D
MHHRSPAAGGNPLRRDADRTRTRLRAAFALACLLAVVCGVAVGRTAWTDAGRDAAEIARHRHSVAAVTVGETTHRAGDGPSTRPVTVARATWRDHENRVHTETVPVPVVTRSGDTVRLWVDDAGQAASAPPGTPDIALNAIGLGTGAAGAVALAAGVALYARQRIVDARSARAWEREWESVEPRWSGRLRPGQGAGDD